MVGGAIPMLFVAYTSAPFVSFARIKLPPFARRSREQLAKWILDVPQNTEIHITTMNFSGLTRVTRMLLSDLNQTKARLGVANLVRRTSAAEQSGRKWWMTKEPHLFYIANESTKAGNTKVWQTSGWQKNMWRQVMKRIPYK